jgi:hypothetical protein
VCTHNEIVIYDDWPPRTPSRKISLPGFNDLHHCYPWRGAIAVANTGLETVDIVSPEGDLLARHDLLEGKPGAREIDPSVDYRLIPDTKPHVHHGNHLFELNEELWVGQLRTKDAVRVEDPRERLDLEVGMPHDGIRFGDRVGFTTTNGFLVFFDVAPPHGRTSYSLVDMTPGVNQLGWCRGMASWPDNPDWFLVGFSSLRRSKWKEFQYWFEHGHKMTRGHLGLYDLAAGRLLRTWQLVERDAFQIFQIDFLPEDRQL